MSVQLHCWGNEKGYLKFHPESLAAIWYLLLVGLQDYEIITSSNTFIAELPFLKDGDSIVSGFESIVYYLKQKGFDLDANLNEEEKIINVGLKSLISDKINIITQYTLFLNKENYENYSRGLFKQLLPFPMQYAPPLNMKSEATRMCSGLGLTADNGLLITEEDNRYKELLETERQLKLTPSLGALHSSQKKLQLAKLLLEKSTVNNMRAINLQETYLSQILELKQQLGTTEKPYIFGDEISSADVLLYAQLTTQTMDELPNSFMKLAIEYKFPTLNEDLQKFKQVAVGKLQDIPVKVPTSGDYPSLFNYLKVQALGYQRK